jgi:glycosyltransferase A (GT-A) superfamily protein (DUF2064 family)
MASANGAAVLVMARAPRRGEVRRALEPLLGRDRCVALQLTLIKSTVGWAKKVAPSAVHVAHDPPDSGTELRQVVGDDVVLFPQNGEGIAARLADAAARVFGRHRGPLLIVWPDLPRLSVGHASGALEDLRSGCDVVFGPSIDGGFYMIGIARPLPRLFALPENVWRSPDAMAMGLAAVQEAGLEIGLLRAERALHRPGDVRAALADPLLPGELVQVLRGRGG